MNGGAGRNNWRTLDNKKKKRRKRKLLFDLVGRRRLSAFALFGVLSLSLFLFFSDPILFLCRWCSSFPARPLAAAPAAPFLFVVVAVHFGSPTTRWLGSQLADAFSLPNLSKTKENRNFFSVSTTLSSPCCLFSFFWNEIWLKIGKAVVMDKRVPSFADLYRVSRRPKFAKKKKSIKSQPFFGLNDSVLETLPVFIFWNEISLKTGNAAVVNKRVPSFADLYRVSRSLLVPKFSIADFDGTKPKRGSVLDRFAFVFFLIQNWDPFGFSFLIQFPLMSLSGCGRNGGPRVWFARLVFLFADSALSPTVFYRVFMQLYRVFFTFYFSKSPVSKRPSWISTLRCFYFIFF